MTEASLEKLVPEQDFASLLEQRLQLLCRLANTLLAAGEWSKRHYFDLHTEADEVESYLDDYGARYNRTYCYLTELAASLRGFSMAGLSLEHLGRRIEGYGVIETLGPDESKAAISAVRESRAFIQKALRNLLQGLRTETEKLGLAIPSQGFAHDSFEAGIQRFSLPRNVGQEDLQDEEQKIAEVASNYLQACAMMDGVHVRRIDDEAEREEYLRGHCTEEQARVYEATVHNLQSAYDTYIKNTVLEAGDDRLSRLRGHISCTLHLLEAVTSLTHFVDRHESVTRSEAAQEQLTKVVDRSEVRAFTLNHLLLWAYQFMDRGRELAEALLPSYTNVQALDVEISDGITVHARPASLIVTIVNHYGTPVEMEVAGKTCNAGSILELMIAVGSHPDARHFVFRGDENPLRDIGLLFENNLGEEGLENLPSELRYLTDGPA